MTHDEFTRQAFDGLNLYFQSWQIDKLPKGVICLVHGLGEHSGRYEHWAALLNNADYSMLTYDLRGHGKSEGQRGHISTFNEFLDDTEILLTEAEKRFPGIPLFLYGHSLGAIIISNYVLRRKPQIAGVILTGLAFKTPLRNQKLKIFLAKLFGSIAPKTSMSTGLDPLTLSKDPEVVTKYKNDPLIHYQGSFGFAKESIDAINYAEQHAGEWMLPLLLMHGEEDKLAFVEGSCEFAEKIGCDCTLKTWTKLTHEVHNEPEKEEVFEYLHLWLDEHIG